MTEIDFTYIDVERTIAEFGYDPKTLSAGSNRKVINCCPSCKKRREQKFYRAIEKRNCTSCAGVNKRDAEKYKKTFKYINLSKTKEIFGYDPRKLLGDSKAKVIGICPSCRQEREVHFMYFRKSNFCPSCATSKSQHEQFAKRLWKRKQEGFVIDEKKYKRIDSVKTIECFGYDPRLLSEKSNKKVIAICEECKKSRILGLCNAIVNKTCIDCSIAKRTKNEIELSKEELGTVNVVRTKEQLNIDVLSLKLNSRTRVVCTCPFCKRDQILFFASARKRKACRQCKHHAAGSYKKRVLTPEGRKRKVESASKRRGKNSPRYGKPAAHGKGSWYIRLDGVKVWMRSTWEVKYAKYLDEAGISWELEIKGFPVTYEYKGEAKEGTYWPDFFINGEWFEVKAYWRDDAKAKFEAFKAQYPEERITLLMKDDLIALGIDLK